MYVCTLTFLEWVWVTFVIRKQWECKTNWKMFIFSSGQLASIWEYQSLVGGYVVLTPVFSYSDIAARLGDKIFPPESSFLWFLCVLLLLPLTSDHTNHPLVQLGSMDIYLTIKITNSTFSSLAWSPWNLHYRRPFNKTGPLFFPT